MRFKQIVETTTAGSVATVAQPMMTQTRENTNVRGLKPVQQVMKGAKKKGPYANSIVESKVNEDDLSEQDLIVIPGQGRLKRTGFVKHDLDQGEHEGETLKNSLHTIARAAMDLDKRLSMQSEFPEWVSEKIGAAKGMMVSVMDYLISSQEMQHDPDAMEGVAEAGLKFNGGFPDVDHMNGPRGINLPSAPTKKFFTDKKQWARTVDDINSSKYDDNSEYTGVTGRSTVSIDGREWARWSDAQQKGYIELSSMSEQGVAEGAKVDRMVKHVEKSEKKLGHSKKEAENIAWATANKRGMLDNKNKKN